MGCTCTWIARDITNICTNKLCYNTTVSCISYDWLLIWKIFVIAHMTLVSNMKHSRALYEVELKIECSCLVISSFTVFSVYLHAVTEWTILTNTTTIQNLMALISQIVRYTACLEAVGNILYLFAFTYSFWDDCRFHDWCDAALVLWPNVQCSAKKRQGIARIQTGKSVIG